MKFDAQYYPYPSQRNVVYATNGMVATGNPSASAAGLEILRRGGNAIDAAVAVATTLPVVEPTGNGIGADNFALIWYKGKLYGLNSSGFAPKSISIGALKERGHTKIPSYGVVPINVPGAPAGWAAMNKRFGNLSLEECMAPGINYAENGYAVAPNVGRLWDEAFNIYSQFRESEEFAGWFDTFAPKNRPFKIGEVFKNQDMANTLKKIAKTNGEAFYTGELAEKIDAFIKKHNGFLTIEDLASYRPEWVDPISVNYRGYDVWEIPPNGHGITVLMALNILKGFKFTERDTVDTLHKQIEAMKLSFVDTKEYVAEPSYMKVTVEQLLSEQYANDRRALITDTAIEPKVGDPSYSGTVYFATADREGNMVSMIQSNFRGFGSGIVIPGTGISLHDRGENFSFEEGHSNAIEGGKRPYHTIIPGFLTKDNEAVGPFGIMGGFMQPQAHVQAIMNTIDFHMNPQSALDATRWQWIGGKTVEVEQDTPNHIIKKLQRMGHDIVVQPDPYHMGRGQIIWRNSDGVLMGGTEKRTDGMIASW